MKTIAISGKGGSGKTTLAALIIQWLNENRSQSILAVDADPNVNLNELLGILVENKNTIGAIREEMKRSTGNLPGGMTKPQYLEYKIQSSLIETPDFDFIAMGRPEGPGCYCYANNLLRDILATLGENYGFVVIDNEAGMEHLSRRTIQDIDHLLIVSDPSHRGIHAALRIARAVEELEIRLKQKHLILNRIQDLPPQTILNTLKNHGFDLAQTIPEDSTILSMEAKGKSLYKINKRNPVYRAVSQMMTKLEL